MEEPEGGLVAQLDFSATPKDNTTPKSLSMGFAIHQSSNLIEISDAQEGQVHVIAECIEVLGARGEPTATTLSSAPVRK